MSRPALCLSRECACISLAETTDVHIELINVLDVTAVLTNQNDAFRSLADCVHD